MLGILLLAAGGGFALYAMSKKDSAPEAKREPLTSVVGPTATVPTSTVTNVTAPTNRDEAYYFTPAPAKVAPVYVAPAPASSSLAKPSLTMSSPAASKSFAKPAPVMSAPVYFKTATKV